MKFIKKITVEKNFNPTKCFYKHTNSFRRLSGSPTKLIGQDYYLWEFSSNDINNGCLALPKDNVDHILIFELSGNDTIAILEHWLLFCTNYYVIRVTIYSNTFLFKLNLRLRLSCYNTP